MKDYRCDDKDLLVAFLYGELAADERRLVETHLETCQVCTDEVEGLSGVRQELTAWLPPEPELGFTIVQKATVLRPARWWSNPLPAWAQAAAAVLVLATGAAIANVQVRYDTAGLTVSTGWKAVPVTSGAAVAGDRASVSESAAPNQEWQAALTALEGDMRREMQTLRQSHAAVPVAMPAGGGTDAALLKRVQGLIDESEQRQRQELALRLSQIGRDIEVQRRADLVRIEQGVGQFQGRTGADLARQREVLNYLVRVSGRQVVPE